MTTANKEDPRALAREAKRAKRAAERQAFMDAIAAETSKTGSHPGPSRRAEISATVKKKMAKSK